jgi:hypothetical protein
MIEDGRAEMQTQKPTAKSCVFGLRNGPVVLVSLERNQSQNRDLFKKNA